MKRILGTALAILAAASLAAPASAATTYGKGVSAAPPVPIADLVAKPADYVGKSVKVEGVVGDVCTKAGCWLMVEHDRQSIRVKVKDGEIVFPTSAKGKKVVAEGVLRKIELTKEQALERAKHDAEETGKPFDPASVTGPATVYQIQGTGAVID